MFYGYVSLPHFEPKNGGGWKMIFLFNWVMFEVPAVHFQGVFGIPNEVLA